MGHGDRLHLIAREAGLRPRHHISKMEISAGLDGRDVAAALVGEEAVDLCR